MIEDAELSGLLYPHTGSRIFEGTVGSTGISLATIARARYGHYNLTSSGHSLSLINLADMKLVRNRIRSDERIPLNC